MVNSWHLQLDHPVEIILIVLGVLTSVCCQIVKTILFVVFLISIDVFRVVGHPVYAIFYTCVELSQNYCPYWLKLLVYVL